MIGKSKRSSWAQPSLSRDFLLLAAAIIGVMLLISAQVTWLAYVKHSTQTQAELAQEAERIERTLGISFEDTGHLLQAVGRQIVLTAGGDLKITAQLLKAYDTGNTKYAVWSWADPSGRIVASTTKGILETPVSITDRDYFTQSKQTPWAVNLGAPIEGRVSGRWIIPVAIGVSDFTGKFLGVLEASIDIGTLTDQISHLVKREGISFAIISKDFVPLTAVADSEEFVLNQLPLKNLSRIDNEIAGEGLLSSPSALAVGGMYSYYRVSALYPYIIVVSYGGKASDHAIRALLWPRLIQVMVVAAFLLSMLWIIRTRVIKPVVRLSEVAAEVASGAYRLPARGGPQEIEALAMQLSRIADYVVERKRLEDELRGKLTHLLLKLQRSENDMRSRAALLAGMLSEYKQALKQINGHAQVLKDQLYGPIENKKYTQYAADIHQAGTTLELMVRKLIALSRVDAGSVLMREEEFTLENAWEQAVRFASESGAESASLTATADFAASPGLRLRADAMHVRQGLAYALLYLLPSTPTGKLKAILKRLPAGNSEMLMLLLGAEGAPEPATDALLAAQEEGATQSPPALENTAPSQLHLSLAEAMLASQNMQLALIETPSGPPWLALSIPPAQIGERPLAEAEDHA